MSGCRLFSPPALLLVLAVWLGQSVCHAAPSRIVSIALCADQYLLLGADPDQIASVSVVATDANLSVFANQAKQYPLNTAKVDSIIAHQPDLVVGSVFTSAQTRRLLKRLGVRLVILPEILTVDDIRRNIIIITNLTHQPDRQRQLLATVDNLVKRINISPPTHKTMLFFGANGYTHGKENFLSQTMGNLGFRNLASQFNIHRYGHLSLEQVAEARPDLLIVPMTYRGQSRAEARLQHPLLTKLELAVLTLSPQWSCATPFTLEAIYELYSRVRTG